MQPNAVTPRYLMAPAWLMTALFPALLSLLAACSKPPADDKPVTGQRAACDCPYLTDYDQVANHSVEVCVPPGQDPQKTANQCAGKLTHGPAEPCKCQPAQGTCNTQTPCASKEYK